MDEQQLAGGVANAGSVTRVGSHVLRPSNPFTAGIHALLRAVREAGFAGASLPVGVDADGRERLVFVRRRVEAGDPNFVAMWNAMGGQPRFDRRRTWWTETREQFARALS